MVKELLSLLAVFIALFLFGMIVMRAGLLKIGQEHFQRMLERLTDSAWKGLLLGAVATALLQSSSAILIMTVGLVATGLLSFRHSIGIILGANIGTTMTTELLAFDLSLFIFPLLILGVIFLLLPVSRCMRWDAFRSGLPVSLSRWTGLKHSLPHLRRFRPFIRFLT